MRASEVSEGLWLRADRQDGGRGRMGRQWESPVGNLYASTIVHWRADNPPPASLAFVAAIAAYNAISQIAPDLPIQIKWPNDLLTSRGEKLCGILLERVSDSVVIGIGINLANHPDGLDRPVTDLKAKGVLVPTAQQATEILADQFSHWLARWRAEGIMPIVNAWQNRAHQSGTALVANLPNGDRFEGHYAGLDDDGALRLCLADGSIHAIHAGDIFLT